MFVCNDPILIGCFCISVLELNISIILPSTYVYNSNACCGMVFYVVWVSHVALAFMKPEIVQFIHAQ